MKERCNNNTSSRHKQREKSKYPPLQRLKNLFFVLCCCHAAMVLAIGLVANNFSFTMDKPPNAPLSTNGTEWYLILVNKWNYVPEDYEVELTELANGQSVDKRIYPALQEMFDTARSNGVYPIVASGYRTAKEQQNLMDQKIADYRAEGCSAKEAMTKAEAWVAIPGTSEHQLGIAADINADGIHSTGDEVYEWLNQNAYKFGFICRYPPEKTEITGVINEPWHYRYVGIEAATEIQNQGVCLEEYLNRTN